MFISKLLVLGSTKEYLAPRKHNVCRSEVLAYYVALPSVRPSPQTQNLEAPITGYIKAMTMCMASVLVCENGIQLRASRQEVTKQNVFLPMRCDKQDEHVGTG